VAFRVAQSGCGARREHMGEHLRSISRKGKRRGCGVLFEAADVARAGDRHDKRLLRQQRRRCLVPVNSFYEWKKTGTGKQPYAIGLAEGSLMALAGLWENWHSPAGEWIRSFAVITTEPNELCAKLHNRMPVVLKPESWPAWLGEEPAAPSDCSRRFRRRK
jgi:putative SOS response-associated peptidase YedK